MKEETKESLIQLGQHYLLAVCDHVHEEEDSAKQAEIRAFIVSFILNMAAMQATLLSAKPSQLDDGPALALRWTLVLELVRTVNKRLHEAGVLIEINANGLQVDTSDYRQQSEHTLDAVRKGIMEEVSLDQLHKGEIYQEYLDKVLGLAQSLEEPTIKIEEARVILARALLHGAVILLTENETLPFCSPEVFLDIANKLAGRLGGILERLRVAVPCNVCGVASDPDEAWYCDQGILCEECNRRISRRDAEEEDGY